MPRRKGIKNIVRDECAVEIQVLQPRQRCELGDTNIRYGTAILAHYLEVSEGDLVEALARYNGSRGRLNYPERVVSRWRKVWRNKSSDELPALKASCAIYDLEACRDK